MLLGRNKLADLSSEEIATKVFCPLVQLRLCCFWGGYSRSALDVLVLSVAAGKTYEKDMQRLQLPLR